jgi:hypothetical protein
VLGILLAVHFLVALDVDARIADPEVSLAAGDGLFANGARQLIGL